MICSYMGILNSFAYIFSKLPATNLLNVGKGKYLLSQDSSPGLIIVLMVIEGTTALNEKLHQKKRNNRIWEFIAGIALVLQAINIDILMALLYSFQNIT